jgi:putative flavoprotein involved in K+ transport
MLQTDAIIIGAGQAGLAMSYCLSARGVPHLVLERGRVAERWRSERWDSLRLLTPNWMSRLPGHAYSGPESEGYMTMPEVIAFLASYAARMPVMTGQTVRSVRRIPGGYRVEASGGTWKTPAVVIATGQCDLPCVPAMAAELPPEIHQLTAAGYKRPSQLPKGGVLVVGASASGAQIAEELHRSGRPVTLSAGRHIRVPRRYRGRDIMGWMDHIGLLAQRADPDRDLALARAQPSFQLAGSPEGRDIGLGTLRALGLRVVGRVASAAGGILRLRDDLAETTAAAQHSLDRLLDRIDTAADALDAPSEARPALVALDPTPPEIDLAAEGIRSVVWATGYRRDYGWLHVPVLDAAGEIRHRDGITAAPGLYVLGLRFLRRRNSSFLDGVGADAAELAEDIQDHLANPCRAAA